MSIDPEQEKAAETEDRLVEQKVEDLKESLERPATPDIALDFMWQAFANLNEWVRFSDTKAAAVLAANGIIVGGLITIFADSNIAIARETVSIVWVCGMVIAAFYSAGYALLSLLPQLSIKRSSKPPVSDDSSEESGSLIFFSDVADKFPTNSEFHIKIVEALADPDSAVSQISQQVWVNSTIAKTKYRRVTKSLFGLLVATVLGFVGILALGVIMLWKSLC